MDEASQRSPAGHFLAKRPLAHDRNEMRRDDGYNIKVLNGRLALTPGGEEE